MSLGIKRFCTDEAKHDCIHCAGWEVDGVDDNGCHTIWFEYECQCPCDGCNYKKKGEAIAAHNRMANAVSESEVAK